MRKLSAALLACMLFLTKPGILIANAISIGMETTAVSMEEEKTILENIHLLVLQSVGQKSEIRCFDVSENGNVAIGTGWASQESIYVYDLNGKFLYGFAFEYDGAYGIELRNEQLDIFFLRGNVLVTYDAEGNCQGIQKIAETNQNYESVKKLLNRTDKTVLGKHYALERNWNIGDSYSKLTVTDEHGAKIVFYDASPQHSFGQIIFVVFIIGFFGLLIRGCMRKATR